MAEHFKHHGPLLRFLVGIGALGLLLAALAGGVFPSEKIGGVIGNNLDNKLNATPLFYMESEEFPRLEGALERDLSINNKAD